MSFFFWVPHRAGTQKVHRRHDRHHDQHDDDDHHRPNIQKTYWGRLNHQWRAQCGSSSSASCEVSQMCKCSRARLPPTQLVPYTFCSNSVLCWWVRKMSDEMLTAPPYGMCIFQDFWNWVRTQPKRARQRPLMHQIDRFVFLYCWCSFPHIQRDTKVRVAVGQPFTFALKQQHERDLGEKPVVFTHRWRHRKTKHDSHHVLPRAKHIRTQHTTFVGEAECPSAAVNDAAVVSRFSQNIVRFSIDWCSVRPVGWLCWRERREKLAPTPHWWQSGSGLRQCFWQSRDHLKQNFVDRWGLQLYQIGFCAALKLSLRVALLFLKSCQQALREAEVRCLRRTSPLFELLRWWLGRWDRSCFVANEGTFITSSTAFNERWVPGSLLLRRTACQHQQNNNDRKQRKQGEPSRRLTLPEKYRTKSSSTRLWWQCKTRQSTVKLRGCRERKRKNALLQTEIRALLEEGQRRKKQRERIKKDKMNGLGGKVHGGWGSIEKGWHHGIDGEQPGCGAKLRETTTTEKTEMKWWDRRTCRNININRSASMTHSGSIASVSTMKSHWESSMMKTNFPMKRNAESPALKWTCSRWAFSRWPSGVWLDSF